MGLFEITTYVVLMLLEHKNGSYVIQFVKAMKKSDSISNEWVQFINNVIQSAELDGVKGGFAKLTKQNLLSHIRDLKQEAIDNAPFPYAEPDESLHSQLNFQERSKNALKMLGGAVTVNATGTELSFNALEDNIDNYESAQKRKIIQRIIEVDTEKWNTADKALEMSEVFRVSPEYFDSSHDREREIESGYIKKIETYELFRSFVWTLYAYCEKEGKAPDQVDIDTLEEIAQFVENRNNLNFKSDSYAPSICSADDIHVYYIPDAVTPTVRKQFEKAFGGDTDQDDKFGSLDQLRKDLSYVYPAMHEIYETLVDEKDGTPFRDPLSDILYAWCSMTYAARRPFFSEDGPVSCYFEYPGAAEEMIRNTVSASFLAAETEKKEEWIRDHRRVLTKDPVIEFRNKVFVINASENSAGKKKACEAIEDNGGIVRTAVSGQTDYLVCDPLYDPSAKIGKAREQILKGKELQIILLDDLLSAAGMRDEEDKTEDKAKETTKSTKNAEKQVSSGTLGISYDENLYAYGKGFQMAVPDGFVIANNAEGRDFVAYLPNEDDPDNMDLGQFIIYDAGKLEFEGLKNFRTVFEWQSLSDGIDQNQDEMFANSQLEYYDRPDLPGAIFYGFDPGCLHALAVLGVGDHGQIIRLLINNVSRKDRKAYLDVVRDLLDRIKAIPPVTLLKSPADSIYLDMKLSKKSIDGWVKNNVDLLNHFDSAKSMAINAVTGEFKRQQMAGRGDVPKLKRSCERVLKKQVSAMDEMLLESFALYVLKKAYFTNLINVR